MKRLTQDKAIVSSVQFSLVSQRVRLFATPFTAACQASLSITNSRSLLTLMSIESVMPSNHLILCHHLLLLPSVFPSIRVFSNVSSSQQVAKVLEFQLSRVFPCLVSFGPIEDQVWQSRAENLFIGQGMGMGEIMP